VLLSGGVGLTPMMSVLETIAARYPNKATHYVQGTLNGATHAMKDRVRSLAEAGPTSRQRPSMSSRAPKTGSATTTITKG
jgi:nitric oxide dioxygenase